MKTKTILFLFISFFIVQIGSSQNTGKSLSENIVFGRKDYKINPETKTYLYLNLFKIKKVKDASYGMAFIPQDSANIGSATYSFDAFWMDATEITNLQYMEFVEWVRDSIAMRLCVYNGLEQFQHEINYDNPNYVYSDAYNVFLVWANRKQLWNNNNPEIKEATRDLFYTRRDNIGFSRVLDTRKLVYEYWYVDLSDTASLIKYKKVPIYPDTLVFMKYYSATYNEPIMQRYFTHPAFKNYPVVGVNWDQATAFCHWRTLIVNSQLQKYGSYPLEDYRLPTEKEWEYAARGGNDNFIYPWGDQDLKNRCNFVGTASDKTTPVGIYAANNYGLYDMSGNVAEWTSNSFDNNDNKVVKGGSWIHGEEFIKNSNRAYLHKDSANYYTGFRCVRTYLGQDVQSWNGY